MKKIAIQGELGSFHHSAALSWYGTDIKIVPCKTFTAVFNALQSQSADGALVAIENSLYGSINEVYDLLLHHGFPIVGEIAERIHQCLIGLPNATLATITTVHSHPVALSQCSTFLGTELSNADRYESYDTAGSVAHIKSLSDIHHAAIASKLAADMHGMAVIKSNIQNFDANYTRFLVLERYNAPKRTANKASLVIETDHQPGALYKALGVLNAYNVNMTKLQSRPLKTKVWRYMFYIDIETDPQTVLKITKDLTFLHCKTTLLGIYPKSIIEIDT